MMLGLRKAKHMKVQASHNGATVGYEGRVAEIARVHHYGLSERSKENNNTINYPKRELLGGDLQTIELQALTINIKRLFTNKK